MPLFFVRPKRRPAHFLVFILASLSLFLWQNCSDVKLKKKEEMVSTAGGVESSELKVENSEFDVFRAVFVIDQSNSMFSGVCPGSIDTLVDNVSASENCVGPTGVDPEGRRYKVVFKWLSSLEEKVKEGKLNQDQIKVMIIPFSNEWLGKQWDIGYSFSAIKKLATNLGYSIVGGFNSLDLAKKHLQLLWAMQAKFHDFPYDSLISNEIRNAVDANYSVANNSSPSSGTSIIAPALEKMNLALDQELKLLQANNLVGKSHFELAFLSDGVPKPHAVHIKKTVELIWASKKEACDTSYARCAIVDGYLNGWRAAEATSCITKCATYLQNYVDTGVVDLPPAESPSCVGWSSIPLVCNKYSDGSTPSTRWTSQIKCGQCFTVLRQFDFPKSNCESGQCSDPYGDTFTIKSKQYWGDWTLNRHANIMSELRTASSIFNKQYPGSNWKMSFLRIDSSNQAYQTPAGELSKEINWIERAKDFFIKRHRFYVVMDDNPPFSLFYELETGQSYDLAMVYAYTRNVRTNQMAEYLVDSDGDGLADKSEAGAAIGSNRSDGKCLDSIIARFSMCIDVGCNPKFDFDGDGLNQCEEKTVGTDEFNPDSDDDFIIDGAEILYGMNPTENDQGLITNSDGFTNFEHFIKGYSPITTISKIPSEKLIQVSSNLVEYVIQLDSRGFEVRVPKYSIQVSNLPVLPTLAITGGHAENINEVVVVIRVDNNANPADKIWMSRVYPISELQKSLQINLSEFERIKLEAP